MPKELPTTSKMSVKKRNRLKRRKKRKLLKHKLKSMQTNEGTTTTRIPKTTTFRNEKTKTKQNNHMFSKIHHQQSVPMVNSEMHLWQETYQTLVRWHQQHESNFWRQRADQLEMENAMLRQKLYYQQSDHEEEYETSTDENDGEEESSEQYVTSSEDDDEDDDVDPGYLEFLEQTYKHCADRDAARAKQSESQNDAQ